MPKKTKSKLDREITERLNWRWQHVRMNYLDRELLGTVRDVQHDSAGKTRLIVHHFNGESWPVEPTASAVKVV